MTQEIVGRLDEQIDFFTRLSSDPGVSHDGKEKWRELIAVSVDAKAEIERIQARVAVLEGALTDAIDGWSDCANYKSEYLREKHGDLYWIEVARSVLSPTKGASPDTSPDGVGDGMVHGDKDVTACATGASPTSQEQGSIDRKSGLSEGGE